MLRGKIAAIAGGAVAIAISLSDSHASDTSDAVLQKIAAMEARIASLEAENRNYRAKLKRSNVDRSGQGAGSLAAMPNTPPRDFGASYAAYSPPPAKNAFDGAYVGVTTGYDFRGAEQSSANSPFSLTYADRIEGGKIGGVLGYNLSSGVLVLGIEARAQYAFGDDNHAYSAFTGRPLPAWIGSCSGSCLQNGVSISSFSLPGQFSYSEVVKRPFSGDVSLRAGVAIDDWLIYGRTGLGIELSKTIQTSDSRGVTTCQSPVVTGVPRGPVVPGFGSYDYYVTGCGAVVSGAATISTATAWSPTVTLAGGIEKNFGPMFARVEAELMLHFPALTATQVYYSPSINLALGYRF